MRCSVVFAAIGLFATVSVAQPMDIHARGTKVSHGPAFPHLQARYDPVTDSVRSDPSRTRRALEARRPQRQTQQDAATRQSSAMRVKAHRVLSAFQGSIGGHAATIQSLCAQVTTAKLRKAAEINQLALDIRAELEAIIAQVQAGTGGIGNCGNGPVPSQGYGNPPSYGDLCGLILQILISLHGCVSIVFSVCARSPVIRTVCGGSLTNLSGCLTDFVNTSHQTLAGTNVLAFLRPSLAGVFNFPGFGGFNGLF